LNNDSLRRIDIFAVLSVIVPLLIYLLTLAPTVTFFDSGEFITAIYSLGSAHSPGYPLFINFAKPFTYLPFGNIAWRVNIATALSAAIACYGVYLLVSHMLAGEELTRDKGLSAFYRRAIALSASLTFAFSARLWLQSNHDKPYPLIAFLSAMVFYLLLLWRDKYRRGKDHPAHLYLGGFLWGLAFGAHQTMVLLLPSFAFLILAMDWRLLSRIKEMVLVVTFALIGFSIHLHLPVRAMRNPLLNWGDPKTLTQFLWHFLRRGYPVEKPDRGLALIWAQLNAFNIPHEFTWVGLALLLLGLFAFAKKRRDEISAYLIGVIFFLLVIIGYLNTPAEMIFLTGEFFTPLYLFSALFIGLGMFYLLKKCLEMPVTEKLRVLPVQVAAGFIILALPLTVCALHYAENDQHANYVAYDYANNTLRTLPERAILYTWGDSGAFPLWYLQGVERMRQDLSLVHTPHLLFPWYLDTFPDLFMKSKLRKVPMERESAENVLKIAIFEQIDKRPVFIDFSTRYSVKFTDFMLQQRGICYRLERGENGTSLAPDLSVWPLYSLRGVDGGMFFSDLDTSKAILIYAYSHMEVGENLMRLGRHAEGIKELRIAEKAAPELKAQIDMTLSGYEIK
jgi:4-amino-4-deoxy-L-arabinose transferase-like glycosyltransferase